MPDTVENELRKKYKVDEYFYPKLDMAVDFPKGLRGEIEKTYQILKTNRFSATIENVYILMNFKRKLLQKYGKEGERRKTLADYARLMKQKQPVGSVVPIDYYLVGGIIAILLYVLAKFGGSFLNEAGKIAAKKLLKKKETKKHLQTELKIDEKEYNLFAQQIVVIINKNEADLTELISHLQKTKDVNAKSS